MWKSRFTDKRILLCAVALTCLFVLPALADWDPGGDYKMHYPQLPDLGGIDFCMGMRVAAAPGPSLADDWQCTESGWIGEIHFWTSWWNEKSAYDIISIRVRIYSNYPVGHAENPYPYSIPGECLSGAAEWVFNVGDFTQRVYAVQEQDFYDPRWDYYSIADHDTCWQINITDIVDKLANDGIPENNAVYQTEGQVYWLWIRIIQENDPSYFHVVGWKNSGSTQFMDAAVWWDYTQVPSVWVPLEHPVTHDPIDLSFVINNSEEGPGTIPTLTEWGLIVLLLLLLLAAVLIVKRRSHSTGTA
jgi:hypothetical protein